MAKGLDIIDSNGAQILLYTIPDLVVGMEINTLDDHIRKHPDVIGAARIHDVGDAARQAYLDTAYDVLSNGSFYSGHRGYVKDGLFCRACPSQELKNATGMKCPHFMVFTVHQKNYF